MLWRCVIWVHFGKTYLGKIHKIHFFTLFLAYQQFQKWYGWNLISDFRRMQSIVTLIAGDSPQLQCVSAISSGDVPACGTWLIGCPGASIYPPLKCDTNLFMNFNHMRMFYKAHVENWSPRYKTFQSEFCTVYCCLVFLSSSCMKLALLCS